ncbi:MAG TPA: hypothetical protein V6C64_01055 [Microcoleaceae cyanobacterium]
MTIASALVSKAIISLNALLYRMNEVTQGKPYHDRFSNLCFLHHYAAFSVTY